MECCVHEPVDAWVTIAAWTGDDSVVSVQEAEINPPRVDSEGGDFGRFDALSDGGQDLGIEPQKIPVERVADRKTPVVEAMGLFEVD